MTITETPIHLYKLHKSRLLITGWFDVIHNLEKTQNSPVDFVIIFGERREYEEKIENAICILQDRDKEVIEICAENSEIIWSRKVISVKNAKVLTSSNVSTVPRWTVCK